MIRGISKFLKQRKLGTIRRSLCALNRNYSQQAQNSSTSNDIILQSPMSRLDIPEMTIDQFIWSKLDKFHDKVALVDGLTDRQLTYGELRDLSRILAIRLQNNLGLKFGDCFGICLPNGLEFCIATMAGLEAGLGYITTFNPLYTPEEIATQIVDSDTKLIFCLSKMSPILEQAVQLSKKNVKLVYVKMMPDDQIPGNGIFFNDLLDSRGLDLTQLKDHGKTNRDIAFLPYSSGTTGKPKGVKLTHRNIISNALMFRKHNIGQEPTDSWQDVGVSVLPFFHIYGLTITMLLNFLIGMKVVTLPMFSPDSYVNAIVKHKATILNVVPPLILFLANYDELEKKHTKSIQYMLSGAAPLGKSDIERCLEKIPQADFLQGYGLTEASPAVMLSSAGSTNYASVGKVNADTEAKVVTVDDPSFRGIGPNKPGEILIRGPQVMKGYHNNPEATKEVFTEDGFLRTGDIGYYDENFEFYITDRLKELIKVKGYQVAPAELEEIIRAHPKVSDAGVIGVPHAKSGEVPKAFVVLKDDQEVTEQEIKDFVAGKVAEYKQLEGGIQFIDDIPKTPTGKILRKELKEM